MLCLGAKVAVHYKDIMLEKNCCCILKRRHVRGKNGRALNGITAIGVQRYQQ